jgi:hypothetical protein
VDGLASISFVNLAAGEVRSWTMVRGDFSWRLESPRRPLRRPADPPRGWAGLSGNLKPRPYQPPQP